MTSWHTLDSARALWDDAPFSDAALAELLEVARFQVEQYAPPLAAGAPLPVHYRVAQLQQARNIWTAQAVDAGGGIGDGETFVLRPHPLDWHVKQLLRPRKGVPSVR